MNWPRPLGGCLPHKAAARRGALQVERIKLDIQVARCAARIAKQPRRAEERVDLAALQVELQQRKTDSGGGSEASSVVDSTVCAEALLLPPTPVAAPSDATRLPCCPLSTNVAVPTRSESALHTWLGYGSVYRRTNGQ